MNELQPSLLLNSQLDWLTYGLSLRDPTVEGENNMSYPRRGELSHREPPLVDKARQRFSSAIGTDNGMSVLAPIEYLGNVHVVKDAINPTPPYNADSLITNLPGIALQTLFADCSPVFLVDPRQKAIGLAHASWQGTLHNVVGNTALAMQQEYGTKSEDLIVYMGPAICVEHYSRPYTDALWTLMINLALRAKVNPVFKRKGIMLHGDIIATNYRVLNQLGVMQIEDSGICTFEDETQPSARRDDKRLGGPYRTNAMATLMIRP